jgi:predicted ATPase/DNA-binding SARP family transcriptional activator
MDGQTTDLPLDRPASLAYHLSVRGDWVRRSELAYLYYPDADESLAFANLRRLIHRLKQYDWANALEADQTRLRLTLASDAQAFRTALEQKNFTGALGWYGGTFLEGLSFPDLPGFEAWLELERDEFSRTWRTAVFEAAQSHESRGELAEAERHLSQLLRTDPLDEDAVQALLRVLRTMGQSTRALEVFERFRSDLRRELDAEPLEATRALLDSIQPLPPRPSNGPISQAPTTPPRHNLPALSTRFIGRKRELEQLSTYVSNPDCRLLTLVGLGGMGKTRLALEAVGQHLNAFPDGVWFVPLSGVASADVLVSSIAAAVGLVFSGPNDPKVQLLNYLREKHMLLLLDNFEHLKAGSLLLEELITNAPHLKLIVTSRVVLELGSEWLFDLEGLSYPPLQTDQPLDAFDAVKLFVNHAERLSNSFVAEGATLHAIATLCRQVQGMPLALELAVSWTRSLSVTELVKTLGQSFDLLSTSRRDVPERQRNLQAILEYTWGFLSETEQAALARLSVFRGGFTLEAGQVVAGTHLGFLLRFINLALVRRGQNGRFELHELIRQWASTQLSSEASETLEQNHLEFFADFLQAQDSTKVGDHYKVALEQIRTELDNVVYGLGLISKHNRWDVLQKVLIPVQNVFEDLSLYKSGFNILHSFENILHSFEDALEKHVPSDARVPGQIKAVLSHFTFRTGQVEQAEILATDGLRLLEGSKNANFIGFCLNTLGMASHFKGNLDQAIQYFAQAARFYDRDKFIFRCNNAIAQINWHLGKIEEAIEFYQKSIEIAQDHQVEQAIALNGLGTALETSGQFEKATLSYQKSLQIHRDTGYPRGESAALTNLGHINERLGHLPVARSFYEDGIRIKKIIGDPTSIAISLTNLADVQYAMGEPDKGHQINFEALELTSKAGATLYAMRVLWSFGRWLIAAGQTQDALYLTYFTATFPESETWVREESSQAIPGLEAALEANELEVLRAARQRTLAEMIDWLKHPGRFVLS